MGGVGEAQLLEQNGSLAAVGGGPGVEIDHGSDSCARKLARLAWGWSPRKAWPDGASVSSRKWAERRCEKRPGVRTPRSSPAADVHHVDLDRGLLAVPLNRQRDLLSDADAFELLGQIGEPAHRLAVHADDHVARPAGVGVHAAQAGALGRGARNGP